MVEKPLAVDLDCGQGGWTRGLLAAGWDVIGVDIEPQPEYPGEAYFLKADVCEIVAESMIIKDADIKRKKSKTFWGRKVSLVVASPPCQEFSFRHLPFGRVKNLPPPDKSNWLACERIARECGAPLVLENVIGAQAFMGKAKAHYGSFYLWGDVPALLPINKPIKGSGHDFKERDEGIKGMRIGNIAGAPSEGHRKFSSKSTKRKEWSANAAVIPFELARWIGECFKNQEANRKW